MGQGSPDQWKYTERGIIGEDNDLVCDAPEPYDCTHLECNVGKPKIAPRMDGELVLRTIETLAARWHRNMASRGRYEHDLHAAGRREGYVQAIALLLDQPHRDVLNALAGGRL